MTFFDLNIPYHESNRKLPATTKTTLKTTRLKLLTKSIELGYAGIAYNHTIKGVMSDSDRCSIPLFPISSILKLSPSLSSSVKFHRQLLNVPVSSPFRQYTRLTVVVDNEQQANALNSGNCVLKTYDLIAVRPLNQKSFEEACKHSQVDIISIDFSHDLQFRLKQQSVKVAVERGVYFEIIYSCLLSDAEVRSHMISNAKLLVDWTRGKNLIISSGASSVTELRGAYDAANLSSLLGLTLERSKAAISKNCRSMIASALRRKHCYKEVIKVEKLPPGEEMNFDDWLKWDPISSAEGDLELDDMGKYFSASCNAPKMPKAIDFASALNGIPSHGLQIKDIISRKVAISDVSKDLTAPSDQLPELVREMPEQSPSFSSLHKKVPALVVSPVESSADLEVSLSCDMSNFVSCERNDVDAVAIKELENVQATIPRNAEPRSLQALSCTTSDERKGLLSNGAASTSLFHCDQSKFSNSVRLDIFTQSGTVVSSLEELKRDNSKEFQGIEAEGVCKSDKEFPLASYDESLHDCLDDRIADGEDEYETGTTDLTAANLDEPHVTDLCSHIRTENAQGEKVEQATFTSQMQTDGQACTNNKLPDSSHLGRGGMKRKTSRHNSLFPFKRFISQRPLGKKARK